MAYGGTSVGYRQEAGWTMGKRTQGPDTRLEARSLAERVNDGERVEKSQGRSISQDGQVGYDKISWPES